MCHDTSNQQNLLAFPNDEMKKREMLLDLLCEWRKTMKSNLATENSELADGFVQDGFYPYYYRQTMKVLFIGRESLGLEGCDYLEVLLRSYRTSKRIGKQHINRHNFHRRMLYVTYSLIKNQPDWGQIPMADKIGDNFATEHGISYAFMNISKFSNETESWQAKYDLMQTSVDASKTQKQFIEEEIALLEPDIVISMNLETFLDSLGSRTDEVNYGDVTRSRLVSAGHISVLLDTWHFSAPNKKDIENFHLPIHRALNDAVKDGWLPKR